jgi:putative heme-binding domain-containing protein
VIHQGIGLPIALSPERLMQVVDRGLDDRDRIVRQEAIRLLGEMLSDAAVRAAVLPQQMVTELMRASVRLPGSSPAQWRNYFDAFERYLIHKSLEKHSTEVSVWLASYKDSENDLQSRRAFAALVLGGADGASRLAEILTLLGRSPTAEELLLVASVSKEPGATTVLKTELLNPTNLQLLYDNRSRLAENSAALAPLLTEALQELVARDGSDVNQALLVKLSAGFRLTGLENQLIAAASRDGASAEQQTAALRALRESGSSRVDVFRGFAGSSNGSIQREAVAALAAAKSEDAVAALLEVWPLLPPSLRKMAVDRLASSKSSAGQLVTAVGSGSIARDELDGYTLDKLLVVLPDDPAVKKLAAELGSTLEPVLRLNAGDGDFVETDLALSGPFTVEAWVKLDPGIGNSDSMLAGQGALDANFHDNHFRVWIGGGTGDIVIAKKPMVAEAWTHIAFTRDAEGRFRIYLNGELENTSERTDTRRLEHLNVGASNPSGGTAGEFSEFRIWNVCQSADRIRATANVALGSIPGTSNHDRRLVYHSQAGSWGKLRGNARIERTADLPPIQSQAEIAAQELKFSEMRVLANRDGNDAHGEELFITTCAVCHTVKGRGGKIGPVLDGAGASGVEALLRNLLSPNAAMEAGYRRFRVETKDGEIQEGLLVSQDEKFVVIRQPNTEDLRIPRVQIKRAGFSRLSVMPEGLIEGLRPQDVSDLFAYLKALK